MHVFILHQCVFSFYVHLIESPFIYQIISSVTYKKQLIAVPTRHVTPVTGLDCLLQTALGSGCTVTHGPVCQSPTIHTPEGMVWKCSQISRFWCSFRECCRPKRQASISSTERSPVMLQFHMWLSFLHPQGVSLQKHQKGLNSYQSSYSFESYVAKQMLYRERGHPLKTIWCLLINKNSVLGVLQQEKRKKAHVDLAS